MKFIPNINSCFLFAPLSFLLPMFVLSGTKRREEKRKTRIIFILRQVKRFVKRDEEKIVFVVTQILHHFSS